MENENFNPNKYVAPPSDEFKEQYSTKNSVTAGLLAIFLGTFGIHDFYLGYTKKGVIHLILAFTAFLTMASTVWAIYDGIMLFMGKIDKDGEGRILL